MKKPTVLEQIAIGELRPNPDNARTHSKHQVEQLRRSLREFGAVAPILIDGENNVIAGHGRLMAAQAEGWQEFPCVRVAEPARQRCQAVSDAGRGVGTDAGVQAVAGTDRPVRKSCRRECAGRLTGFGAGQFGHGYLLVGRRWVRRPADSRRGNTVPELGTEMR